MSNKLTKLIKERRVYMACIMVALAVLALTVGGVSAYLSISSQAVTNSFTRDQDPEVTVSGTTVTVDPKEYSVYLRVAIDADWENSGVILPEEPAGAYTVDLANWKKIGDFYYYRKEITQATTLTPVTIETSTNGNYTLKLNMAAQIIQVKGTTDVVGDEDAISAVQDAWGVMPEQITGN